MLRKMNVGTLVTDTICPHFTDSFFEVIQVITRGIWTHYVFGESLVIGKGFKVMQMVE